MMWKCSTYIPPCRRVSIGDTIMTYKNKAIVFSYTRSSHKSEWEGHGVCTRDVIVVLNDYHPNYYAMCIECIYGNKNSVDILSRE